MSKIRDKNKLWDWDEVFKRLVHECDTHGGYYELPPKEVAKLKRKRPVGEGWGRPNFLENVLPKYRGIYPYYEFGISSDRKYLWCKRQKH